MNKNTTHAPEIPAVMAHDADYETDDAIKRALLEDPEVYEAVTACLRKTPDGYELEPPLGMEELPWVPVPEEDVPGVLRSLATMAIRVVARNREAERKRQERREARRELQEAVNDHTEDLLNRQLKRWGHLMTDGEVL